MLGMLTLILAFLLCCIVVVNVFSDFRRYGILCGNIVCAVMLLFYVVVPVIFLANPQDRDTSTVYNILLGQKSVEDICACVFLCSFLLVVGVVAYKSYMLRNRLLFSSVLVKNESEFVSSINWETVNRHCGKKIRLFADLSFMLGGLSILVIIIAVGGVEKYIALGSATRGINKNVSDVISGSLLPLITLSSTILVSPYLYRYLSRVYPKAKKLKIYFWVSFAVSIIYLLHNQGRLPLLLFAIPFVLDTNMLKRMKVISTLLLAIACIFLLEPLTNLFTYLTYGKVIVKENSGLFETLLLEFTYPFSNFINRDELVGVIGFRYGLDMVQWPLTIIPSSILKIFGISKSSITSIGALNTNAHSHLASIQAGGGVPTDVMTFFYYQFGWLALIIMLVGCFRALRAIDKRLVILNSNSEMKIILLRICFLMVSLINNFDFSVIFRMRLDLVVLIIVAFYISHKGAHRWQ